jgi:hypothetical protein
MDDELRRLLTKPGPSLDTVDEGRHRLQNAMHGRSRRHRGVWLAGGLSAAAAAVAGVIVVTSGGPAPVAASHPPVPAIETAPLTARQILLTAATSAETSSMPTGKYWYVKTEYGKTSQGDPSTGETPVETWVTRDGHSYFRAYPSTEIVLSGPKTGRWADGFTIGSTELGYNQLLAMPTEQGALLKWAKKYADPSGAIGSLIEVIARTPAPPKARAAAFRALAGYPGVKSLGKVKGGMGLVIPEADGQQELVVDPATARVTNSVYTGIEHGRKVGASDLVVAAEWTNRLG